MANELSNLIFEIDVSTRYHEARRRSFERYADGVKVISIIGGALAFAGVNGWHPSIFNLTFVTYVSVLGALIALINMVDLVFGLDDKARRHTDLYRQFKQLQADIALHREDAEEKRTEWDARAQTIRVDEPPTMFAIYARCWNEAIEKHQRGSGYRKIGFLQRLGSGIRHYNPQDFPIDTTVQGRIVQS